MCKLHRKNVDIFYFPHFTKNLSLSQLYKLIRNDLNKKQFKKTDLQSSKKN